MRSFKPLFVTIAGLAVIGLAASQTQPVKIQAPQAPQERPSFEKMLEIVKEAEGKPLPKFEMKRLDDQLLTNKDLEGKVTIIDFWATWCGPCIAAAPKLDAIYREYKDKGLVVIGANLAESGEAKGKKDNAVAYAEKTKYAYTFTYGNDQIGKDWKVPGYPTFFIVDRKGVVKEVMVGFNEAKMRALVAELTK
jgi:thiol-disulfide isomerase/thioredoxin